MNLCKTLTATRLVLAAMGGALCAAPALARMPARGEPKPAAATLHRQATWRQLSAELQAAPHRHPHVLQGMSPRRAALVRQLQAEDRYLRARSAGSARGKR